MDKATGSALFRPWVGKACADIVRFEYSWQFSFPPAGSVTIASLWRIIRDSRVVLCSLDDGQKFGLPHHIDAAQVAYGLVFGKIVSDVSIENGDLTVKFSDGTWLQVLINSSGYESWNAACLTATSNVNIIATGGGELAIFQLPPR